MATNDRSFSNSPDEPSAVEKFRGRTSRIKIHPLELAVLWAVAAHLIFLPWAIGGMWPWAHVVSLGLAVVGLGLALMPRQYSAETSGRGSFKLLAWPKLLRFPIFWLGLALLGYIALQATNPAWAYRTDGKGWWMEKLTYSEWLPRGVEAPFERWNQWRMLLIYSSAWLTLCTIWIGFTRRRTLQLLVITLAANGLALVGLGLAQRFAGNGKIYWFFNSSNASFFSSFVYKNHAGAYLLVALTLTCGLAGWFYLRGLRRLEKSNPSGVLMFLATCIAVGILTSYARGATLTMLAFLILCIGGFVAHQFMIPSENRRPLVMIVLLLVFGYFLKNGLEALRSREAWDRMKAGLTRVDTSLEMRESATEASLEMLKAQWTTGVGAGAFRYIFPIYQAKHPALNASKGPRMFWAHAHNDVLQFPIELGVPGIALILAAFGYWVVKLIRSYFWENPLSLCVIVGALFVGIYSWWDFPFQCPAVLITWLALWPIATKWAECEERGSA